MARYRNKSSDELSLRLIGDNFTRVVGVDEVVEVPDAIAANYAWPESTWESVQEPKKTAVVTAEGGE